MVVAPRLRAANATVLAALARVGHALAHPTRLKILNLLAQSSKTVTALAALTGESVASTSAHLRVLAAARVVRTRRLGREMHYSLAADSVEALTSALRRVGEELSPDIAQVTHDIYGTAEVRETTPRRLLRDVRRGLVTLVDLRPPDEFEAGRLPGAVSVPLDRVKQRVHTLPARTPVAAYCRGPLCVSAVAGVRLLRQQGLEAARLPFGVAEWKAAGYRLERGSPS